MDSPYRSPPGASAQRRRWAQSSCREQSLGVDAASFLGVTDNAVSSYPLKRPGRLIPRVAPEPLSSMQPLRTTVRGHEFVTLPLKR